MGDILGGDSFGVNDRFDTSTNLFGPDSLNGIDAGIVGINTFFSLDGLKNHGPLVASKMIFSWNYTTTGTDLSLSDFTNINPLFGTDGETLSPPPTEPVPEPATMALLGIGLAGLGGRYLKRRRKQLIA